MANGAMHKKKKSKKVDTKVHKHPLGAGFAQKDSKAEVKEVSWIEKTCPKTMTPTQFGQMIVQNAHNFQGGKGPEIQKAKDYLSQ